jgi:hypothetical protein
MVLLGCGESPLSRSEVGVALSAAIETENHTFHLSPGDVVESEWQESFHAWALREIGLASVPKIQYFKYLNRSHLHALTGQAGNAWADPATFSIHTIWPTDNHEVVHLYASRFGSPTALFSEGFAVAHQVNPAAGDFEPKWSSTPVHTWARRFRQEGRLIPVADLIETSDFRRFDDNMTYPEAGSFIRHLIDEYGLDKMLELFRSGTPNQTEGEVRAIFLRVYGISVETAEESWMRFLDG